MDEEEEGGASNMNAADLVCPLPPGVGQLRHVDGRRCSLCRELELD